MAVEEFINNTIVNEYNHFISSLPDSYQLVINIFLYTAIIIIYSIFVFLFYRFVASKNILKLNLSQYNKSEHPLLKKFLAAIFFLIEYIIVLPFLVFFWFAVLAFLILLLSKEQPISQILLISAAIVGAIRITSYFKEDLSRDLAKMFPFTVLAIFLLSKDYFEFVSVIGKLAEIPLFLRHIVFYLGFVVVFEIFIRLIYTFSLLFKSPVEQEIEDQELEIADKE